MATQNKNVPDRHNQVFAAGLETSDGTVVGLKDTSKVGFFGKAPVARPAAPTDAASIIAALQALGLVAGS